jgi:hypothetical protein
MHCGIDNFRKGEKSFSLPILDVGLIMWLHSSHVASSFMEREAKREWSPCPILGLIMWDNYP